MSQRLLLTLYRFIAVFGLSFVADGLTAADYTGSLGRANVSGTLNPNGTSGGVQYRELNVGSQNAQVYCKVNFTNDSGSSLFLNLSSFSYADPGGAYRVSSCYGSGSTATVAAGASASVDVQMSVHYKWTGSQTYPGGTITIPALISTKTPGNVTVDSWTADFQVEYVGSWYWPASVTGTTTLPTKVSSSEITVLASGPVPEVSYDKYELNETFANTEDHALLFSMRLTFPGEEYPDVPIEFTLSPGEEFTVAKVADAFMKLTDIQFSGVVDLDTGGYQWSEIPDIDATHTPDLLEPPTVTAATLQTNGPTVSIEQPDTITEAARVADYSTTELALETLDSNNNAANSELLAALNEGNSALGNGLRAIGQSIAGLRGDVTATGTGDGIQDGAGDGSTVTTDATGISDKWTGLVGDTQTAPVFTLSLSMLDAGMDDMVIDFGADDIEPYVSIARQVMLAAMAVFFLVVIIKAITTAHA